MKTRRQKYRQKMQGGAILGEGVHGITYNLCKKDKESFCDELDKQIIREITLYTSDGTETLSKKEEIDTFLDMLHKKQEYIAKIFKSSGIFVSTTKKEFEREIDAHRNIIKIYNKNATKVLKRGLSRDELYETYKYSFDLFMLGMTLVYLIYDKPSYHKQYTPIIHYLTSLTDPPKNAKKALKHIKSLLK